MRPSADLQMRTVNHDFAIGENMLPQGWRVIVNATTSHFPFPEVFDEPYSFDPLRWSPERGQQTRLR